MLTVLALFPTSSAAENSLQNLKAIGVADADITAMFEGNVASELLERHRFTGERAAGVIASGDRVSAALVSIGMPESLAVRYAQHIEKNDAILVAVRFCEVRKAEDARQVLVKSGGEDAITLEGSLADAKPAERGSEKLDAQLIGKPVRR
jgi:hypothetical protein